LWYNTPLCLFVSYWNTYWVRRYNCFSVSLADWSCYCNWTVSQLTVFFSSMSVQSARRRTLTSEGLVRFQRTGTGFSQRTSGFLCQTLFHQFLPWSERQARTAITRLQPRSSVWASPLTRHLAGLMLKKVTNLPSGTETPISGRMGMPQAVYRLREKSKLLIPGIEPRQSTTWPVTLLIGLTCFCWNNRETKIFRYLRKNCIKHKKCVSPFFRTCVRNTFFFRSDKYLASYAELRPTAFEILKRDFNPTSSHDSRTVRLIFNRCYSKCPCLCVPPLLLYL
jgi:hypothetical protein